MKSLELAHLQLNRCLPSPLGAKIIGFAKPRLPKLIKQLEAKQKMLDKQVRVDKAFVYLSPPVGSGSILLQKVFDRYIVDCVILRTNSRGVQKTDMSYCILLYADGKIVHEVRRFDTEGLDPSGQYPSWSTLKQTEMP